MGSSHGCLGLKAEKHLPLPPSEIAGHRILRWLLLGAMCTEVCPQYPAVGQAEAVSNWAALAHANKDEKIGRPSVRSQCPSPPGAHILAQAVCQQVEEALRPVYEATAPADVTCHFYEILAGWKTGLDVAAGMAFQSF